ncbi:alpha-amylase family glycosyl hydrolase [Vibrio chaetopteri]|uniref:alpha-amylase family glycosyl hydrolase n=1 Tax=Vibrio chaetopteri TaxID=3016528 RepID=UPI003B9698E2
MKLVKSLISLSVGATLLWGCSGDSTSPTDQGGTTTSYACRADNTAQTDDLRIYQVMVESFVDGNPSIGHGTGYGTSHHMGDIQGIIDSLDYIQDLGMNAVWLTPIFNSVPINGQDHWADRLDATGYFATDYFAIDPRFGTMDDAKKLVEEAHKRGLYVFFDGVFGHHKDNVMASPTGNQPVGASNPVSYPESLPFFKEVAEYWVKELKIDGWRLDQAYQVPTDAWAEIRKAVDDASQQVTYTNADGELVNPLGYMVAEIWRGESDIARDGYGSKENPALCSAFDFPMRYRLVQTFAVEESGYGSNQGGLKLAEGMRTHDAYPAHAKPNLMLGNHDLVRLGDLIQRGNLAEPEDAEYWQRHKAAISFLGAYTGPITLYYGEEIGDELEGFADQVTNDCAIAGKCDDHVARMSGKIEGVTGITLTTEQADLKNYVKELMTLRSQYPSLAQGTRNNVVATTNAYGDLKTSGEESILYIVNTTASNQTIAISADKLSFSGNLNDLQTNDNVTLASGFYNIDLAPFQARFLSLE